MQEHVGLLIAAARRRIKQAVIARIAEHRLTVPQFWILIALAEHPGIPQTMLAEQIRSDPPTVSRTLTALIERRLARAELDPDDRRRTRVSLTPAGERLAAELSTVATEIRAAIVEGMTEEETVALRHGLRRVVANLDRLESRGSRRERP